MDQLKDFLKQCVKYRFWIAFGVSMLLPMIGYFVGVGGIVEAQAKAEASIKSATAEVGKYSARGIVNGQYQPEAAKKNALLTKDVDASWRELRNLQEPLLRWPEEVEAKFLRWGRKFPNDVDAGEVRRTLTDYSYSYPTFVSKIYKIFKPFNYEDGSGIVVAPDEKALLKPAPFSVDDPPTLSKVWAEQERIWVVTALLDAVAKINESVKATNWDTAIVKQINLVEVGSQLDQDQKSITEGIALVPGDVLLPEGQPAPAAPAAPAAGPGGALIGAPGSNAQAAEEVYYLKNDSKQYKTLPIKMTVLVDQAKLADFLVGLENSPITIQVMEAEVVRPTAPVSKPEAGDHNTGSMMKMGGGDSAGGPGRGPGTGRAPVGSAAPAGRPGTGGGPVGPGMAGRVGAGGGGGGPATKGGVDARSTDKRQIRKDQNKDAEKKAEKIKHDQYYNIVEVTVYGQARFYLAPPPLPASQPSTAAPAPAPAPTPEPAKTEPAKPATPAPTDASKPAEAPKTETPAPKAEETKPDAPKTDTPKAAEAPKGEAPKGEAPAPKS